MPNLQKNLEWYLILSFPCLHPHKNDEISGKETYNKNNQWDYKCNLFVIYKSKRVYLFFLIHTKANLFFYLSFPAFENVFYLCVLFVYELSFIVSDQIKIFIGMFWR